MAESTSDKKDETPSDKKKLEGKERAETLLSLANSCWTEFDTRRSYEWKVSLGLWASLGLITGFLFQEDIKVSAWYLVPIAVIFVSYVIFQYGIYKSNRQDQEKRFFYILTEIHPLIGLTENDLFKGKPRASFRDFIFRWSHLSQILVTTALLVILSLALSSEKQTEASKCCDKCANTKCH